MPTLFVVIPVFEEPDTLEPCVRRAIAAPLPTGWSRRLLLVDDASSRATADVADRLAREFGGDRTLELLRHPANRGKGAALRTGFDHALATAGDADAVLTQDGDLEYDPADWAALLDSLPPGSLSAVIGDRWAHPHEGGLWRRLHTLVNRSLTALSNLVTGLQVNDMECGSKLLRVPVLRAIRPWLSEDRFGVEPQMVAALSRVHAQVAQAPVTYDPRDRRRGKKIGPLDGLRAVWVILRERLRRTPPRSRR
ncbi:MAG: glycosyltransferase family 2 protein [Planctomycetes bacterium]|nr:glycosyltransferase family 2 protein [Planctomycetota bacterium]